MLQVEDPEPISRRLRRLRTQRGLSVAEIAEKLQVSQSTYRDWEYGRQIRGEPYAALAEILDVTVSELLFGKTPSKAVAEHLEAIESNLRKLRALL